MGVRYRLSTDAKSDLNQIWDWLAENASVDVADKVVRDIRAGMELIAKSPGIGHSRTDLTKRPVKFFRVHRYLILFTPSPKPIVVVRVLHGSRDIPAVLGER